MSASYIDGLKTHAVNEGTPFAINTLATAALTYGGQYLPKVVEVLSFDMALEGLALGTVMTTAGGSLATVAGKTFAGEDKMKNQFVQIATYMLGAGAAAYFIPQVATLAGFAVTFENAMATFAASTVAFIAKTFLFSGEKKPAEKDDSKQDKILDMKEEDFKKLAGRIANKEVMLTDKDAARVATDRVEVTKTHEWSKDLYNKHVKDGKLDLEAYKKEGTEIKKAA